MKTLPHSNCFCRLGVSKISGVGVIAICDIPKGTVIFSGNEPPSQIVPKVIIDALPKNIQKLYHDFSVFDGDNYVCPDDLNELTVGWFFNDSDDANVDCVPFRSRTDGFNFIANRDIKEGNELTVCYNKYERDYLLLHSQKVEANHVSAKKRKEK